MERLVREPYGVDLCPDTVGEPTGGCKQQSATVILRTAVGAVLAPVVFRSLLEAPARSRVRSLARDEIPPPRPRSLGTYPKRRREFGDEVVDGVQLVRVARHIDGDAAVVWTSGRVRLVGRDVPCATDLAVGLRRRCGNRRTGEFICRGVGDCRDTARRFVQVPDTGVVAPGVGGGVGGWAGVVPAEGDFRRVAGEGRHLDPDEGLARRVPGVDLEVEGVAGGVLEGDVRAARRAVGVGEAADAGG